MDSFVSAGSKFCSDTRLRTSWWCLATCWRLLAFLGRSHIFTFSCRLIFRHRFFSWRRIDEGFHSPRFGRWHFWGPRGALLPLVIRMFSRFFTSLTLGCFLFLFYLQWHKGVFAGSFGFWRNPIFWLAVVSRWLDLVMIIVAVIMPLFGLRPPVCWHPTGHVIWLALPPLATMAAILVTMVTLVARILLPPTLIVKLMLMLVPDLTIARLTLTHIWSTLTRWHPARSLLPPGRIPLVAQPLLLSWVPWSMSLMSLMHEPRWTSPSAHRWLTVASLHKVRGRHRHQRRRLEDRLPWMKETYWWLNTLRYEQNGKYYVNYIWQYTLLKESLKILFKVSHKVDHDSLFDIKSALVQVMACHQTGENLYLDQCWTRSMTAYVVSTPLWINARLLYV